MAPTDARCALLSRRCVLGWLGAGAGVGGLSGCDGREAAADAARNLKTLTIPGVAPFAFQDESNVPLDVAAAELRRQFGAKGASQRVDGDSLAADGELSVDDIAQRVGQALGPLWQRSSAFLQRANQVDYLVWESRRRSKRFYALMVYTRVHLSTQGRRYRPMLSMFAPAR